MPKLDRYLLGEFTQSFLATLIVLLVVSLGGVLVDVLGSVAEGKLPAGLLLSQLGLNLVGYLPMVIPMALMLGLLLAFSRLYRDSEMPVLVAAGVGPKRMLRPLLLLVLPVVAVVAMISLWLGPLALRTGEAMIESANRSLVVAGLEPGQFTVLNNGSVVYVGGVSADGRGLSRIFMQRQRDGRMDVVTAQTGSLSFNGENSRFLQLNDGFRVEGPLDTGKDFRLMRYKSNDVALPDSAEVRKDDDPEVLPTPALFGDARPEANAQLHARLAPAMLTLAFALLSLPLSRSSPRTARYGRTMFGFLGYLVATLLMINGTQALSKGSIPGVLGLWWLTLPLLAAGVWFYLRDGRLSRPKQAAA